MTTQHPPTAPRAQTFKNLSIQDLESDEEYAVVVRTSDYSVPLFGDYRGVEVARIRYPPGQKAYAEKIAAEIVKALAAEAGPEPRSVSGRLAELRSRLGFLPDSAFRDFPPEIIDEKIFGFRGMELSDLVMKSFTWSRSPQGHEFWRAIHQTLVECGR